MKTEESQTASVRCRNIETNKQMRPWVEGDCLGHSVGCPGAGYDASGMGRLLTVCMRAHIVALAITLLLSPNVFADQLLFRFPGEEPAKADEQKDVELVDGKHGKASAAVRTVCCGLLPRADLTAGGGRSACGSGRLGCC